MSPENHPHHEAAAPSRQRWTLRVAIVGLLCLIAWASVSKIDQVTHAQAQIIASAKTQVIQSPELGVITHIHVKEGETVKAGQLLVTLEKERAQSAVSDSNAKIAALRIALTRLHAEVYGRPLAFDDTLRPYADYIRNQTDLYNKRKQAIDQDVLSLQNMRVLADRELQMNLSLEATGDVGHGEILRLRRSVADLNAQITNKRNKYFQDAQAEMTKAQEDLNTQGEMLRDRSQLLEHTELMAPADGIVKNIKITTIGAVIRAGDIVMEMLPLGGDLIAETKIMPADIGFIVKGQSASVKLDAYDYSIFGAMQGEVIYISADTITEETQKGQLSYYRVNIRIRESEFKGKKARQIEVRPGMTASVDIKAMERTVLSYLTKPISKTFSQSMGER
ncbi:HlyD family efflux transporter periplasmic adaptor subunit [Janthinobacterium lividum]|jgi:adhesin transport system membrane fusion protein|uniref:HlyD family efflux transporter periplasmic adaptor subunit n=1 Tax=Janthinobacterium lividum TaxID=29581 RepID=UPI0008751DFE|nr:HlyD family efflux transporter periplasmic adaptor subunit [Janthinobacterium lividum]MCC7716993.1 HlyD family efflux transporter periplasmic adaptor subunit [Janthinobacterium lividum]OEZ53435.1 type I secretion system membrane fusion protein PrsE [Janthinobacterium lividum]WQE31942.1 HlyD family efflux transporter periplasmic adaptor subunit [Janthinobacterium lividum]STS86213.1 Type I secretion system membrane fusion protein PrsE [Janthinobacterium lividum]